MQAAWITPAGALGAALGCNMLAGWPEQHRQSWTRNSGPRLPAASTHTTCAACWNTVADTRSPTCRCCWRHLSRGWSYSTSRGPHRTGKTVHAVRLMCHCIAWLQFTIAVTRRVLAPSQAAALDVAAFQVGAAR